MNGPATKPMVFNYILSHRPSWWSLFKASMILLFHGKVLLKLPGEANIEEVGRWLGPNDSCPVPAKSNVLQ